MPGMDRNAVLNGFLSIIKEELGSVMRDLAEVVPDEEYDRLVEEAAQLLAKQREILDALGAWRPR